MCIYAILNNKLINVVVNVENRITNFNIYYNKRLLHNTQLLEQIKNSSTKKIIKCLSLLVLSQEAKLKSVWGPTLTPLIGKDKITDFCNIFNKDSILLYDNDVYIPVFFYYMKIKHLVIF